MQRALLVSLVALAASACSYTPKPRELIHIVDSPADVRVCTRLGEVSPTVPTVPGFGSATDAMLDSTLALGGTHLYLQRNSPDWSLVRGIAYRCGPGVVRQETVIRAKG
ncbi:hypothetical protein [Microvirga subterranea]|uniref:Uncharacterized protein n=1 Tax=Microvirga subterranea TaxID=186651 RepID=A0A370HRB9_9HYPH|nr:hypothetical protein [Microvirga subterranea]RDI61093.1 hypothetical protein DES45_102488 [Microvirga subterranea]